MFLLMTDVIHVEGGIDPLRDIQIIDAELLFQRPGKALKSDWDKLRKQSKDQ